MDKIAQLRNGEQIVPKQVHFIISDLCNQDCHFCAYRSSTGMTTEQFGADTGKGFTMNPNRMIESGKACEILNDMAELGVKAVQFTGGGEPTVHPDHLLLFAHAQALGMQTSLVTNGARLREGWEGVFNKMAWIRVSVDAGKPETYGRVRRVPPSQYGRTIDNIERMGRVLPPSCLFGAGFVVTRENYKEIFEGCLNLKHAGVSYVRLCAMFSTDGPAYYEGIYKEIKGRIAGAKALEDDEFKIVDLFGDRISDLREHSPDYSFCGYQQFVTYIGGNLKVYRCCTTSYTAHGEVGDLSDKTFKQWFTSERKNGRYAEFDARTCAVCQFNGQNRVINYLLETEPIHVDFV
jgi:MoaA/NifB/PqqE/SkfB family radical SAM enzyme